MPAPRTLCEGAGQIRGRGGFTLVESVVTAALLGIGVTALMVTARSGTQVNAAGREQTQAAWLVQEIREWTLKLPFRDQDPGDHDNPPGSDGSNPQYFVDDLDDLMGVSYSPPRDADGYVIYEMQGWSQSIALEWRNPDSLDTTVTPGFSDVVRVTVTAARNGRNVLEAGWLVVRRDWE